MTDTAKPDLPIVRISAFDAFAPEDVDVRLVFDDHVEVVPMRTISYAEFQQLGQEVTMPTPPVIGAGKTGPVLDFHNADYLRAVQDANRLINFKRLLRMLRFDVPGKDETEQIAALQHLDTNRLRMLMQAVVQLAASGEVRVEAKSATFHKDGGAARPAV